MVLKTEPGAEPFFQNVRFNPVFDRMSPVLGVFTGPTGSLFPVEQAGLAGPVFKT